MFKRNTSKTVNEEKPQAPNLSEPIARSSIIPKFLSAVSNRSHQPVLIDLGPVIGSNISLFNERLSCKFYIQDLFVDIETYARNQEITLTTSLAERLISRFPQQPNSCDGILCWDLFDYLDPSTSRLIATKLSELLRSNGMLYGLFSTVPTNVAYYTRFVLDTEDSLRHQIYPATPTKRKVIATRDIHLLCNKLEVTDLVLRKSATRETLFKRR